MIFFQQVVAVMAKHQMPVRIYYEDTDAGGVVYNANYLKFFERGRTEFLRDLGFEQDQLLEENVVFAVRKATVDFKSAARFNDIIDITTKIEQLKKVSVVFTQTIYRGDDLICQAQIVVACLKADEFKPMAIPSEIMIQLKEFNT